MTVKNHHTLKQLLSLARTEKKRLAVRVHVVARAKQGLTCLEIMKMTGYCRRTIQRWVTRYNQSSIKALVDEQRSGRSLKLPVEQYELFCA